MNKENSPFGLETRGLNAIETESVDLGQWEQRGCAVVGREHSRASRSSRRWFTVKRNPRAWIEKTTTLGSSQKFLGDNCKSL